MNFYKKNSSEINTLGEPYDFLSIMHYSNNTFSNSEELNTLTVKEKHKTESTTYMGQRHNLSRIDIHRTNKLYNSTSEISLL